MIHDDQKHVHYEKNEIRRLYKALEKLRFKIVRPQKGHHSQKVEPSERSLLKNHFMKNTLQA